MQSFVNSSGVTEREFFMGGQDADVLAAMDARKVELEREGASGFHRTKIGGNTTCPCGSGRKFKKCCMPIAQRVRRR